MLDCKYYKRKKEQKKDRVWISKLLLSAILLLISLIYMNFSDKNKELLTKNLYEKNFNFSEVAKFYDAFISHSKKEEEILVNNEGVTKPVEKVGNSYKLDVKESYNATLLNGGIIVYIGEKEDLGNTVIVQGNDGVDIWYSNIIVTEYGLYDYVSKGDIIGISNDDYIYLTFCKNGNYLEYDSYVKKN